MEEKLELVLDIAGVIATNFSPMLWKDLSLKYEIAYDDLVTFRKETREDLWTGKMEVREFWMNTLLADDKGEWTKKVVQYL